MGAPRTSHWAQNRISIDLEAILGIQNGVGAKKSFKFILEQLNMLVFKSIITMACCCHHARNPQELDNYSGHAPSPVHLQVQYPCFPCCC